MKIRTKDLMIILLGFFMAHSNNVWAHNSPNKKHDINWSININKHQDSIKTTLFNLGLISNTDALNGVSLNLFFGSMHGKMKGVQLSGIASYADKMSGFQLGGLANFVKNDASGLMTSALINAVGGKANGLLLSAITNVSGKEFKGLSMAGILNLSTDNLKGVQIAGVLNASARELKGVQTSLLSNVGMNITGIQWSMICNIAAQKISGLQLAGVANVAMNTRKNLQVSSLTNICLDTMNGVQLSLGNYAENVKGAQIGLLNLSTGKVNGWQIGIVNHSKDTTTHKIGLVNIHPKTKIQAMLYGSNTSKINVAVRFKNKRNYSIIGVGTHYFELNKDFSGCLFYRTGLYIRLKKKFEISGDLGYFHIETFEDKQADVPERMYSLQARINLEYKILPKLSLFATSGYATTRHYKGNKRFENKGIIEAGFVLF